MTEKTKLYIPSGRTGQQAVYILDKNSNQSYSFVHEIRKTDVLQVDGVSEFANEHEARESAIRHGYAISGPSSVRNSLR